MVHTHAPQQRGRWNDDENEMKVKVEWKLPNQDAKRGTQEKRERANTNTTHLAQNGQNPEKARKKKSESRRTRNQTSGGGGGRKRLNQPNKAKPKPTSARAGPNLPEGRRTQEHMRKGTHGGLVNQMMHPHDMQGSWSGSRPSVFKSTLWTAYVVNPWITCTIEPHQRP